MPEQNFQTVNNSTAVLPVLVWGTAANGQMFREHVTAKELTHEGALLIGMPYPISMGDLVGLQYKECKAHARVTKIPQLSGNNCWSLWVELLEKSRCPWALRLMEVLERSNAASPLQSHSKNSDGSQLVTCYHLPHEFGECRTLAKNSAATALKKKLAPVAWVLFIELTTKSSGVK